MFVDGRPDYEEICTGWINYLFHEDFRVKNKNPWKLFDAISTETDPEDFYRDVRWDKFLEKSEIEGMVGCTEIHAVQDGIDAMLQWHDDLLKEAGKTIDDEECKYSIFWYVRFVVRYIRVYRKVSDLPVEEQFRKLCDHIKAFYQESDLESSGFIKKYGINQDEEGLYILLEMVNLPALVIKTISEVYEKDFWKLWGEFRDIIYESTRDFPLWLKDSDVIKIPTAILFGRCADDMIYYWQEDGDIHFSDELEKWFLSLKKRYDEIMSETFTVVNPARWILELMNYAEEEYYHIFTFAEFFEESEEHLSERSYIALWKLYEEMLHDPKIEEAGSVIFVLDDPEYKNEELYNSADRRPQRRLRGRWSFIEKSKRENFARVTLRRYMALVANAELRKKVFGF